ncbi:hypothetical protein SCUCBS95973_008998 [Sporothrix curviconia]|uniref:Uncharacterized protein n=1 Tax=Sporothrix curviconia TaxID=1260050 RepID=A0ABP0CR73_9PEZI
MCEYTQREYACGHFKFIAARWCNLYRRTHRRCPPEIAHFEYRTNEICGQCRPQEVPAWQHLVRSNAPVSITGITGINSLADCYRDMDLVPWLGADRRGSCTRRPAATGSRVILPPPATAPHRSGSGLYAPPASTSSASASVSTSSASSSSSSSSKSAGTTSAAGSSTVLSGKISRDSVRRHAKKASVTLRQ